MSNPHKRFLSERAKKEEKAFLDAARNYMGAMSRFEFDWLYRKPYDNRAGNEQFYLQAYAVMNLVRAMDIRHGGRILEVGSGPGWVSELLMLLGYDVDGIEPSADFVAVARERIERAAATRVVLPIATTGPALRPTSSPSRSPRSFHCHR